MTDILALPIPAAGWWERRCRDAVVAMFIRLRRGALRLRESGQTEVLLGDGAPAASLVVHDPAF